MSLDIDLLRKLHEFGAMNIYRVVRFDPMMFRIVHENFTFDETKARTMAKHFADTGAPADVERYFVKFDGAFSQKTDSHPEIICRVKSDSY